MSASYHKMLRMLVNEDGLRALAIHVLEEHRVNCGPALGLGGDVGGSPLDVGVKLHRSAVLCLPRLDEANDRALKSSKLSQVGHLLLAVLGVL